ncbi:efflux RND transporter permease subunit, partial [Alistipes sp.]|uniref:efflux RND transporter permease subunit n=1 Tax=Alistipes sp. TaxID=1872444 RepID=UPI00307DA3CE
MEKFFVSRPIFAISLAIVIVLVGLISIMGLPIEQYPDITPPVVEVSATYDGADAETVNNAVATPVAQAVMGVSDMLYMQATSANDGSMVLQVTFDIGSDPDLDAIFTQNNVSSATAELPATVTRQGVTTRKTMTGFLMVYSLHSDGRYDGEFLSNYAYINLQNELLKIDGVGKVSIMGAGEYAMRVWLRPDVLKYYGIAVDEVTAAIEKQGGIYPAGQFGAEPAPDGVAYTYTVTMPPQISTAAEFADIVVRTTSSGEQIRLGDIAEVSLGSQTYGVSSSYESAPTAMIVIYQQPGSNAVAVGGKVKAAMERLSKRFPDGVEAATIVDSTTSIDAGVKDIFRTLAIALILVIFIIFLFLQDWRATVIPLVAIPVSLVGAFALFPLLGFSINIISLLGLVLAIGLVVDDAIVVVEAAQVNIERGMKPRAAALEAMRNVASPIVATTVVLLAVFVPVSFTGGITGRLFQQFSVTIAVSVVISAFNALTLSPALCALLLRHREPSQKGFFAAFNRWFARQMDRYTAFTPTLMRHVARTGIFVAVVLGVIFVVWRKLPAGFLPEEDQGYVMVMVSTPEASSLQVTRQAMADADAVIRTLPEVASTSFAAGFNMMAGIASTSSGIIFVKLVDYSDRKLSAMQIAQRLTGELYVTVPGAECYAFIPPSIPGLGVTSGVSVEVQDLEGRGTAYLMENAGRLMDSLRKSPAIASVTTQFDAGVPQRRLRIDKQQALAAGVDLGTLYGELTTLLGGAYINNFTRFGKLYQTYIQAAPDYRLDRRSLDSYYVTSASGESVPVASLVEVADTVGVEYVSQFNLYRSVSLTVTPAARASTTTVMREITATAAEVLPDDIGTAWSGTSYQEANASKTGGLVYALALVFVFLALAALYESWGLPLAILMSVPVAVLGAVLFVGGTHLMNSLYVNDIYMQIS